jgi:hypothetical protein
MAERHWKEHLPEQHASLTDPTDFFRQMGEEAAEQVETLAETLAAQMLVEQPGPETFAQTSSRLAQAQHAAEATVVREFLLPTPPETEPTLSPEDEELTAATQEFASLRDSLRETLDRERETTRPQ